MNIRPATRDENLFHFAAPQAVSARSLQASWIRGVRSGVAHVIIVKTPGRREAGAP